MPLDPIVVQIKGGPTKVITGPAGAATRLVELSDVDATPVANGDVLTYVSANGKFEFHPTADSSNAFGVVNVAGQNNVIATTPSDTLELIAGTGILVLTDNVNNSVTIVATGGSAFDQYARDVANGAYDQANAAYANANTAIYTAAQIRANISNTAPINYSATTGIISHADSGVTATTYGNTTYVPTVTVDARGHVTSITNTAITFPPSGVTSVAGKTGAVLLDTYDIAENTSSNLWFTAARVRSNISNTAPINYEPTTGVVSHADSGVVASGYGDAATVPKVVVDSKGHATSVTNTSIAISAVAITSGTLAVARGGTGQTAITVNGSLLIGNTVSGGFDVNPITQGAGILVTNDKGSITITANVTSATDQFARDQANAAYNQANNAYANANTAIYTAAQIRANISNTAPINYDPTAGVISHALSGVAASGYGDAATVAKVVVDSNGHVTSVVNTAIAISAAAITSGTLAVVRGGTGQTAITVNGSLLIGNTVSSGFDVNPITQGAGILITNDKGSITITANVTSATDQFARDQANAAFNQANTANVTGQAAFDKANGAIYTAAQIRANLSNTAPINYDATTGVISHALSGVTASGYGDAATVAKVVVDSNGHVTSVVNTAIAISATQITSGTLAVVRGGTAQTAINGNGSLLIGNTVSGGYDVNTLTQGTGIIITNDKGSITIEATGGAATDQYARDKANGAAQNAFVTINIAGQSDVVADSNVDTLILVAGTGILLTTDSPNDTITITATGGSATDQFARDTANGAFAKANGAAQNAFVTLNVAGQSDIVADSNTDTLTIVGSGITITTDAGTDTLTIQHPASGVVASGYGDAATVPKFVVDANGHVTSVTNTAIAISATQITSGTLTVARGGTGQTAITVNGSLLIGNTVSGGFDVNPITQGTNITVTNDKGSITISSSDAFAQSQANAAYDRANAAYANANTAIYTAAQIRANLSNTTPINYDATTGVISHALSGVAASGYGDAATVAKVVVDSNGHVTSVTNTAIAISATQITSGTLAVVRGGTGQTAITVNGSLLIGNTVSGGFDVNPITQGTNITVTNDKGSITISSSDAFAQSQANAAYDRANAAYANANTAIYTAAQIRANLSNTAPINYDATTGVISHAVSGVAASGYGDAATVPKVVVDVTGHVTSVVNTAIAISAAAITSGTLAVARGGTGQTTITVNGSLLIGNTVSGGFDVNPITQGTNITITNDKGSITIASSDAFAQSQANAAFDRANAAYANANTAIYTAAQIRANLSNTAPINYDATTGVISHAISGVTASGYGDAATVAKVVVDTFGHVTSVTNTAIAISAAAITSGTLAVARGGTAQTAINGNGSLLIGNTVSGGYDVNTLTQGTGIVITNDKGSITIAATGGSATDDYARAHANGAFDKANGAAQNAFITLNVAGQSDIVADSNVDTLILVGSGITLTTDAGTDTLTIQHPASGVVASGYGDASTVPKFVVDANGHVTSVTNTAIAISATQITSGTLAVARGGTGQTAITVNGSLLIGNTVSGGFDVNPITQGTNITVTNDKGSITISSSDAFAQSQANAAFDRANAAYANANTAIYTAAQIRANLSNTAPINYDATTGVISHALSGVTASGYGDADTVAKVVVDSNGHVTSVVNTAIAISATQITSGTLAVARGGTGQTAITVNGSLLIGNTVSGGFDVNPITQGTNITVTNDKGSIAISSSDAFAQAQANAAFARANAAYANANTAIYTAAQIRANLSNTAPINYDATTGVISHALSGVTASGYGDAATVAKVVVDSNGHVTSVVNTAIAISATQITSGTLAVVRGGTGQTAITVNGSLLIGNTVSGGFDVNPITQGTNITVTNDKGSITISSSDAFAQSQANAAFDRANAAYANANTAIYTAAQIRANLSNTAPINYDATTGVISHALSGVTASGYGDAATVAKVVVDSNGHVTSVVNTAIAISATQITSGTLAVVRGGTAQTAINGNGSLLIGNTVSGGYDVNTLTQGSGIVITNDKGSITVAATGGAAIDQYARDKANGAAQNAFITLNVAGQSDIVADSNVDTLILVGSGITLTTDAGTDTLTIQHPASGVTPSGYGDAATVPKFVVDANGHVTSVTNTAIAISATQITSGTLAVARGGTGQTAITVNGSLLIGNTVSGGFDVNPITQGTNILITNDKGSITIASSDAFAQTQANAAFDRANAAYANANTAIYTAAQIRANISNTAPIRYDATTGIVSHADSGVVASGYGDAATIPVFVANATGHISSVTNTAIAISATQITSGTLAVARGGTAQTAINGNGSLLIGNTVSGGYDVNTLTQGTGIVITNDKGSISIAATGGASANGFGIIEVAGQANVVADQANDTLLLVGSGITLTTDAGTDTLTIQHPASGVVASGYGDAATVPKVVVDANGHLTSVVNTSIAISATQITSGTLAVVRGGTGQTAITVNGSLLIGNTVSGGFDVNPITQGTNITVTNDKGSITISSSDAFAQSQANAAFDRANAAYANANTAIYTAAQIRANLSNTAPINYDATTGIVSHALSGVTASGYGDAATVAKVVVDSNGHVTSVVNTAIAISATQITSGTLAVARGGTGQTAITVNGSLLIGNTVSGGFDVNTLTQGTGIVITNDKGSITIEATGGAATDQFARDTANGAFAKANGAAQNAFVTLTIAGQSDVVADSNVDTLTLVAGADVVLTTDAGTDTITFATSRYAKNAVNNEMAFIYSDYAANGVYTSWSTLHAAYVASGSPVCTIGFWQQAPFNPAYLDIPAGAWAFEFGTRWKGLGSYSDGTSIRFLEGATISGVQFFETIYILSNSAGGVQQIGRTTDANGAFTIVNQPILHRAAIQGGNSSQTVFQSIDTLTEIWLGEECVLYANCVGLGANANTFFVNYAGPRSDIAANSFVSTNASAVLQYRRFDARTSTISATQAFFAGITRTEDIPEQIGTTAARPPVPSNGHMYYDSTIAVPIWWYNGAWRRLVTANIPESTSNLYFTAARVRANISNTAPINYDSTTGIVSHATSGVTATGYGDANTIPVVVVDNKGHLSSVTNTAITFSDGSATSPSIPHRGDLDTGFWFPAADTIAASTNGLERLRITDAGYIGIGTNNPVADIELLANAPAAYIVVTQYSGAPGDATDPEFTTQAARGTPGTPAAVQQNDTLFVFGAAAYNGSAFTPNKVYLEMAAAENWTAANNGTLIGFNTTANNSTLVTRRMLIDGNGNIGIANSSPKHKLSITGNLWVRDTVVLQDGLIANGTLGVVGSVLTSNSATPRWTGASANGQLFIGNTVSGGYDVNTLTQGSGIVITNTKGAIEIAATGGAATDQFARDTANGAFTKANGAVQTGFTIYAVSGQSDIVPDSNTDTITLVGSGITLTTDAGTDTLTVQHPASGVTASGYGDAATVPKFVVDANGHVTSVTNTAIAISATAITSGTLAVARGGTGQTAITVNGSLLIGNTVSGGFDVNPITATTPIVVTNDKGSIALTHATSGVVATGHGDAATVPKFIVDDKGHVTSVTNTTIAIAASAITSGVLIQAQGGTGFSGATANGQLLIGNTVSGGFDRATLTQGTNITITNAKGSITIDSTGGAGSNGFGIVSVSGQSDVVADQANDTLTIVAGSGITITTAAALDRVNISGQPIGNTVVGDSVFFENGQTVTGNYTITTGKSAISAGPITLNPDIIVTVPGGSRWVIV
jgi:uncharacterized protein YfiM (DUF2279 family)